MRNSSIIATIFLALFGLPFLGMGLLFAFTVRITRRNRKPGSA